MYYHQNLLHVVKNYCHILQKLQHEKMNGNVCFSIQDNRGTAGDAEENNLGNDNRWPPVRHSKADGALKIIYLRFV